MDAFEPQIARIRRKLDEARAADPDREVFRYALGPPIAIEVLRDFEARGRGPARGLRGLSDPGRARASKHWRLSAGPFYGQRYVAMDDAKLRALCHVVSRAIAEPLVARLPNIIGPVTFAAALRVLARAVSRVHRAAVNLLGKTPAKERLLPQFLAALEAPEPKVVHASGGLCRSTYAIRMIWSGGHALSMLTSSQSNSTVRSILV